MGREPQLSKTTIQLFWELSQLLRERRRGWVVDGTRPLCAGPVRIMNSSLNNSYRGTSQKHKLICFSEYDGWEESSAQQRIFSLNDWNMRWNVNGQLTSEDKAGCIHRNSCGSSVICKNCKGCLSSQALVKLKRELYIKKKKNRS